MAKKEALIEELTEKQKAFCREYIFDWNATRAAKAAGYSENTASEMGYENLNKPQIKAYIEEIQKDLEKLSGISRLKVLQEHQKLAFSSIAHLHNSWITRKEFEQLTEDQKASIEEISTQTRFEKDYSTDPEGATVQIDYVKIKLYSKQKSLDSINKMLGYDVAKKIELSAPIRSFKISRASERTGNTGK
jgi:phage terminase small subunit